MRDAGGALSSASRRETESRTLLECASSLGELVENTHATCIAHRVAELETASAAAVVSDSISLF